MIALAVALLLSQVRATVPADSLKCTPDCKDAAAVMSAVGAVSFDACVVSPATTVFVVLEVTRKGAVTSAKVEGPLAACLSKQLKTAKLPPAKTTVRLSLVFQGVTPLEVKLPPHQRCPAPGYWDEQSGQCRVAPCAGIPGGCPDEATDVPVKKQPVK